MKYITLLFALFVCAKVSTAQVVDGINYTFSGSDATVTSLPTPAEYTGDVVIPSTVTYNSVTYNVTAVGISAFSGCSTLTSVTLSDGIRSIANNAFLSCRDLSSISIPEGVTTIGSTAFLGCASLTSVTLPESLYSIGGLAFRSCINLVSIVIPNGLTTIGVGAFFGCKKLSSIIIPAGINEIPGVFNGCTTLTSIYSLNTTPPRLSASSFSGVPKDTLYVMAGSLSAYQGALEWKDFKTIIELRVDVTAPAVCLGSNVDLTSTVSVSPVDATVEYFESDKTTPVATPTAVLMNSTTTYYAQMTTIHGYKSDMTPIVVTVNSKPTVAPMTLPAAICEGSALTLPTPTVTAQGTPVITQTWKLDGVIYTPGALLAYGDNGKTLTFTASSACGDSVVVVGTITVYQTTAVATQPAIDNSSNIILSNGYIRPGSNVTLINLVAVGHNLQYQWYKDVDGIITTLADGGKYSGTTSSQLTIGNAYETENGNYYVTVTGTCGTATSTPVTVVSVANQDASLKDLKVNGTAVSDFNPARTSYMMTISCETEQISLLGIANNAGASVSGNGTFSLQPGDNYLTIAVTAQDLTTTMTYAVNVIRTCYVPKIIKDLEDALVCINGSYTWSIEVEGENLSYEWYCGNNRVMEANSNTITINDVKLTDYERYYVIVRSNYNGVTSSAYSKRVKLWVADYLPSSLKLAEYPNPATVGKTYHIKVDGYQDVTKYRWSYNKEGVTFSPEVGKETENETWATFGTLSAGTGTLTVTMDHPCGMRELTQTITVSYPTGVEDVTAAVVAVYPNPTSGILKVSGTVANQMIKITDITGSVKGSCKTQEGTTTIDLSSYAKGTYLIQYNDKSYKVIRK